MESPEEQQTLIHEVRNKRVISQKEGQPTTTRIARYLKPIADNSNPPVPIPTSTPLLSEIFPHDILDWPTKVIFKGWNSPQRKWQQWVESLAEKHCSVWNQTGILDAIMGSVYEVQFYSDMLLGLAEFWCPETNTFVFRWGEAGLTLEDVAILGGLPVVGEGIGVSVSEELVGIVEEMERQREKILKSRAKKAAHLNGSSGLWRKREEVSLSMQGFCPSGYQGGYEGDMRWKGFVFPSVTGEVIGRHVFPIAAALSKGKPMALAPAVLGNLYKDLRELKEKAMDSATICSYPYFTPPGEPRIARWNKLNLEINQPLVRSALQLAENFKWRPYAADLENWRHPSYYKETEQPLCYSSNLNVELRSFFHCLKASELVSVDGCKEKYLPNRVAMQFAWCFEEIYEWWKDMMLNREAVIKDVVVERRNELMSKFSMCFKEGGNGEGFDAKLDMNKKGESDSSDILSGTEDQISSDSSDSSDDDYVPIATHYKNDGEGSPAMDSKGHHLNHDAKSPEIPSGRKEQIACDSSDDDNVPIATRFNLRHDVSKTADSSHQEFSCNQSQNVVSSTPKTPGENSRKRKLHATPEGISQEEVTKKPTKGVAKEVKVVGCSVNEPNEIDELAGVVKRQTKGRERAKGVAKGKREGRLKGGLDLQRRVENIEKLLGVNPD
ncbi:hypothetical protein C3L33_09867, partial [Rhododendron williamsianum]